MTTRHLFFTLLIIGFTLIACQPSGSISNESWIKRFSEIGTFSSPRLIDLTGDGVLDIVIGAAKKELTYCDTAVIALDGRDGAVLWTISAFDQMVGSASFVDISQDGLPDVVIGGRNAQLLAVEGKSGKELWRFKTQDSVMNASGYIRFNFYNSQVIPDQNEDGVKDLLLINGGNVQAAPNSSRFRYPGVLTVLSSKDGAIIYADTMPDGQESYMSPLIYDFQGKGDPSVLFGTGGETEKGHLFIVPLSSLQKNNIREAKILLQGSNHGFIAPPVLVDLNLDGTKDIVANYHGGITYAVDGKSHEILWQVSIAEAEANSSLAVGHFNEDEFPDIFTHFNKGTWPKNTGEIQLAIDGRNGEIMYQDTLGDIGMFSPLAADLDQDSLDEVLLDVNHYNYLSEEELFTKTAHYIALFDFQSDLNEAFTEIKYYKNLSSTPWLGDMDGDNYLDIIYCEMINTPTFYNFYGLRVCRKKTNILLKEPVAWGAYMGNNYDGVYTQ